MIRSIKQIETDKAVNLLEPIDFGKYRKHKIWDVPFSYWQYMESTGAIGSALKIKEKADAALAIYKAMPTAHTKQKAPEYKTSDLSEHLRDYQSREIMRFSGRSKVIINGAIGSGKTIMALEIARLYGFPKTLIVCPKTIHSSWEDKIKKFTDKPVIRLKGTVSERADIISHTDGTFYLINPEVLKDDKIINSIAGADFKLAFFDESHLYLQNHSTQTFKAAKIIINYIDNYYTMTGSLAREGRESRIVDQLHLLNPVIFNNDAITSVYKEHFWLDSYYKPVTLKPSSEAWFSRVVSLNTMIITADELKLPEPVFETIEVPIEGDILRAYEKAAKEMIIELGDDSVQIPAKIALITRLRQISGGVVLGKRIRNNNKIPALLDIVKEFDDESFVVACQYLDEIEMLKEALNKAKITHCEVSGNISGKDRDKALDDFRTKAKRCIILQTDTGGVGIDGLQEVSRYCIIYSGTYQSSRIDQLKGRLVRHGQKTNAVFYQIIGKLENKKSIDEIMMTAVENKIEKEKDFIDLVLQIRGENEQR